MKKVKKGVLGLAVLLLAAQMPMTAMAHSGDSSLSHKTYVTVRGICNTAGCNEEGIHRHGKKYYSGHSMEDGHDYHEVCGVEDCTVAGVHQHDGVYFFEHTLEDGHDHHTVCNVIKGCTEITEHEHNANTITSGGSGHHNSNHGHGNHH